VRTGPNRADLLDVSPVPALHRVGGALLAGLVSAALVGWSAPAEAAPKPKPSSTKGPGKEPPVRPTAVPTSTPTPTRPPAAPTAEPTVAPRPTSAPVPTRSAGAGAPTSPRSPVGRVPRPPERSAPVPATSSPGRPAGTATPTPRAGRDDDSPARRALDSVTSTVGVARRDPELPLGVVAAMGLFLLVQHRIDRRDPKLARGGRAAGPVDLSFRTPVRTAERSRPLPTPRLRVVARSPYHVDPTALPRSDGRGSEG
jgi:hypothetical protein